MLYPLYPEWQLIARELRQRYGSDDAVADELSKQGVLVDRTTLLRLRHGQIKSPGPWGVGAALLNLFAVPR